MKKTFQWLLSVGIVLMIFPLACKKNDSSPSSATTGLSTDIQKIAPKKLIDTLRAKGVTIYEGNTPPKLAGIYLCSPYTLMSPYGPEDSYKVGKVISDYKFKFYEQSADNVNVKVDYTDKFGIDKGVGSGSFVSGNGNFFTIFGESSGKSGSLVTYKELDVYSGEITSTGIKNFQNAFIITEKTNDPSNVTIIGVGKGRAYKDGDGLAEITDKFSFFRLSAQPQDNYFIKSLK